MALVILGVDPGMEGGIAVRTDDELILFKMPLWADSIDFEQVSIFLRPWARRIMKGYLELQSIRPMQAGQFKIGRNFGNLEATIRMLDIPLNVIRPDVWSAAYDHGVTVKGDKARYPLIKKARAKIAIRVYPGISFLASEKSTVPHSGLVDAALIADYGWNLTKGRQ